MLHVDGGKAIAEAIAVSPSLNVADLRCNKMDIESATMLANVAKEKKISLCGITPDQTVANLRAKHRYNDEPSMKPADAILLTADLAVRSSLTQVRAFLVASSAPCLRLRLRLVRRSTSLAMSSVVSASTVAVSLWRASRQSLTPYASAAP